MSSFEMELERKLEIPDPVTNAKVMDLLLEGVLSGFDPKRINRFQERRRIQYYDLPTLWFAIRGWTVRRVSTFGSTHPANHRYDMKIGTVGTPERQEKNCWHDRRLTPSQVVRLLEIRRYREIIEALRVRMRYDKTHFGFEGAHIEASLDEVRDETDERVLMRELEFELLSGSPEALEAFMLIVRQHFPVNQFPASTEQKYTKLARLLGLV